MAHVASKTPSDATYCALTCLKPFKTYIRQPRGSRRFGSRTGLGNAVTRRRRVGVREYKPLSHFAGETGRGYYRLERRARRGLRSADACRPRRAGRSC
jgi:hypothetical protein